VEYLKGQIQTTININPGFLPSRPNDTTTTIETTTIETTTIGTTTIETTTAKGPKLTRSYFIAFIHLILFLFLL